MKIAIFGRFWSCGLDASWNILVMGCDAASALTLVFRHHQACTRDAAGYTAAMLYPYTCS